MSESWSTTWKCEKPAVDVPFRVTREEWSSDFKVRTIHEIRVVDTKSKIGEVVGPIEAYLKTGGVTDQPPHSF